MRADRATIRYPVKRVSPMLNKSSSIWLSHNIAFLPAYRAEKWSNKSDGKAQRTGMSTVLKPLNNVSRYSIELADGPVMNKLVSTKSQTDDLVFRDDWCADSLSAASLKCFP